MSNSQKKYLTSLPQLIACYLTAYFDEKSPFERVVHFEVFNVHKKSFSWIHLMPGNVATITERMVLISRSER